MLGTIDVATLVGYLAMAGATLAAAVIAAWSSLRGRRESRNQLSDLITWTHIHHEQDNEIRVKVGMTPATYPDLVGWRNAHTV